MIQVKLRKGEHIDRALKRLKRIMDNEGIFQTLRDKKHYKKPSELKREKKNRAKQRTLHRLLDSNNGII